jgi:copper chaperone/Cu+-exporting ATPase
MGIYTSEGRFRGMGNKAKLSIEGMHCDACVRRVTNALNGVEGVRVESVEVGSANVVFDAAIVAPEQIAAAVDRIGFTAHIER